MLDRQTASKTFQYVLPARAMEFLLQLAEREPDQVPVMEIGAQVVAQVQPERVKLVDILRPEPGWVGTKVDKG